MDMPTVMMGACMLLYALVLGLHVCVLVCPKITYIQISVTVKKLKTCRQLMEISKMFQDGSQSAISPSAGAM